MVLLGRPSGGCLRSPHLPSAPAPRVARGRGPPPRAQAAAQHGPGRQYSGRFLSGPPSPTIYRPNGAPPGIPIVWGAMGPCCGRVVALFGLEIAERQWASACGEQRPPTQWFPLCQTHALGVGWWMWTPSAASSSRSLRPANPASRPPVKQNRLSARCGEITDRSSRKENEMTPLAIPVFSIPYGAIPTLFRHLYGRVVVQSLAEMCYFFGPLLPVSLVCNPSLSWRVSADMPP